MVIMTNCDQAQIAALESVFPQSQILFCLWHVLHAMHSHFITTEFQGLWEKIKIWVKTEDIAKFYNIWDEISNDSLVPESVVKYLKTEWLPVLHRWSMIGRKHQSIFEEGNTNMLVEAYVVYLLSEVIKLTNLRYHHILKTHCLGRKHNRCIDYIIQALVIDYLPELQNRHSRQLVKLEGPNLEAAHRRQILASARNISPDSIHKISKAKFFVTSQSRLGQCYLIDLSQSTCECHNFPRIQYCKHIAAINLHFPQLCPEGDSCPEIPERVHIPDLSESTPREEESAENLLKDINALYQQLNALSNRSTLDLKALKSVKYSLTTAIALANGSRVLPKKDVFNPNRNTWAETAERMGAGKVPQQKPGPTGGNTSTACIGPVKGKHTCKYTDPYAGGKRSGKHAKPDALSTTANERAHVPMPTPPPPFAGVLSPACASPSTALSFTHANPSMAGPVAYLPSGAAPGLAFLPYSAALPGYMFAPSSAAIPWFAHAGTPAQTMFRAEIMPGNAFAHAHFPPGHPLT